MTYALVFEQIAEPGSARVILFLMAAGLDAGARHHDIVNLAHCSLYMLGSYLAVSGASDRLLLSASVRPSAACQSGAC